MADDRDVRTLAGTWESDQKLIAFARARLRELELEHPQGNAANRYVRASQRFVEEFVDRRRAAGRDGHHGREALSETDVWGLRIAVTYIAELWADHDDFREEWRS
jgi:hypothetical protein